MKISIVRHIGCYRVKISGIPVGDNAKHIYRRPQSDPKAVKKLYPRQSEEVLTFLNLNFQSSKSPVLLIDYYPSSTKSNHYPSIPRFHFQLFPASNHQHLGYNVLAATQSTTLIYLASTGTKIQLIIVTKFDAPLLTALRWQRNAMGPIVQHHAAMQLNLSFPVNFIVFSGHINVSHQP